MCEVENYCYNLGCGKKFKDAANHAKACTFHSGKPYFHDAYKVSHDLIIARSAVVNEAAYRTDATIYRLASTLKQFPFGYLSTGLAVIASRPTFPSLWP